MEQTVDEVLTMAVGGVKFRCGFRLRCVSRWADAPRPKWLAEIL
jgi:hypothetical protein